MGNAKLGLTGEFAAIIKSREDERCSYFVSKKAKKIYDLVKFVFPESSILKIFDERLALSKRFDRELSKSKARQIVELGCGYSLRGYTLSSQNPDLIYVDVDLPKVIAYKRRILEKICISERRRFPINYHLVSADVVKDDLSVKLSPFLSTPALRKIYNYSCSSPHYDRNNPHPKDQNLKHEWKAKASIPCSHSCAFAIS